MSNGRSDPVRRGRGVASKNAGGNAFSIGFDFTGVFDSLDETPEAAGKAARVAAQAGAEEFYLEVRIRCPVSAEAHYFYGRQSKKTGVRYLFQPGNLRDSIYQVYSKDKSIEGVKATYHIAWNHRKAPYGFMVEFGTPRAPASPFLRPAYDSRVKYALEVARIAYVDDMKQRLKSFA